MEDIPEEAGLEIGDLIVILGGQLNKTVGKVYGFSEDQFTIQPRGLTDRVLHIPVIDGLPDEELGIQEIKILKKAAEAGFVHLVDLRAGQYVETFDDTLEGRGVFKVISVDPVADSAIFADDAGIETVIEFGFTGIPRDLPYKVIRTREPPAPSAPVTSEEEEQEQEEDGNEEQPLEFVLGQRIELPAEKEIQEVGTADRIFLDIFQRSDLLGQLIRTLPLQKQRDPVVLQNVRRTVELFILLRNDVVKYGATGEPRGSKQTSLQTLAEIIGSKTAPLARKVANITKVLYAAHTKEHVAGSEADPEPFDLEEGLHVDYLYDILKKADTFEKAAQLTTGGQPTMGMPRFFLDLEKYRQEIQMPFLLQKGQANVEADEEVFRNEIPSFEEPLVNVRGESEEGDIQPVVEQAPFAITRILKSRTSRFLTGDAIRVVEPGEAPSFNNTLIFPRSTLRDFGPIRSGILAQDISLGMTDPTPIANIIRSLGSVSDFPTAQGILNIGVNGVAGNVTIKDWLDALPLVLYGPGDVAELLSGYLLNTVELNAEQTAVLQKKIQNTLGSLRIFITTSREENKATLANLRFEQQSILDPESATRLLARIESEPLLQKILENLRAYIGDLAAIDINWFSYMYLQYPDLVLSILGQQANLVAKERIRFIRDQGATAQKHAFTIQQNLKNAGLPPTENTCPHVKKLEEIRKIAHATADEPRDVTKMKLMIKLLGDYRGKTEENWVWCKVCNNHLMCAHELLNIQEYLRPKEQEVIHKELILKFSGGQFSGKFICRTCGLAIAEMDFDTNLEFDDQGRPMMGRAVMEDRDEMALDQIKGLIAGPSEAEEELNFGNEELNTAYKSLKTIAGLIGINPEESDYRTMLEGMSQYLVTLPSRDAYAAATKGKKAQDYDIYYSIRYVSALAAILLVNVQTHIPEYTVYYTSADCKDGFFGYPLESEANVSGIQCLTTVTAGINENEFPWNLTTLQKQPNLLKRRDGLQPFVFNQVKELMKNPIYQAAIKKKQDYRMNLYGAVGGMKRDQLAQGFRPIPYFLTEEDAAKAVITPEGGKPEAAWIRIAHGIASANSALNPDAVLSETSGCLHPITKPAEFWTSQTQLPTLEAKASIVTRPSSTKVSTGFSTDKKKEVEGEVDATNFYKLFMDICYQGENKGLPHELGIGLSCGRCGIHFQENPNLPTTVEADSKKKAEEEEKAAVQKKAHIESQGVVITEETFYDLLNTAHQKAAIQKPITVALPRTDATLQILASGSASPTSAPFDDWSSIMLGLQTALKELGPSPSRIQIATAAQLLVAKISEKEEFIKARLGPEVFGFLENMTQRSPRECGEALRAYILIPFQRWITGIGPDSYQILNSYGLSKETMDDILQKGMGPHLQKLGDDELEGLAKLKVQQFVSDLQYACSSIFPSLRGILMPGGSVMVQYVTRAFVMGYVARFLDPHYIPDSDGDEEFQGAVNMKLLYTALAKTLSRYFRGSRIPTEQEIRTRLEQRVEAEKQKFLSKMDRMSRDERRVELVNKNLGLGEWAVGGTKAIRQYDPERYEAERAERAQAGLVDYADVGAANAADGAGRAFDMFGYVAEGGEGGDGGYDHDQIGEDDF